MSQNIASMGQSLVEPVWIEPALSAVYKPLFPKEVLQDKDVKLVPGGHWQMIDHHEVGELVSDGAVKYARAHCPFGKICDDDERVDSLDMLAWHSATNVWKPVDIRMWGHSVMTIREDTGYWIARPAGVVHDLRRTIPDGYREMYVGERLTNTDIFVYQGAERWRQVVHVGVDIANVPVPNADNNFMLYARYVGPGFRTWYISAVNGKAENMGELMYPWPSVEVACAAINKAVEVSGIPAIGVIYNLDTRRAVFTYDLFERPDYGVPDERSSVVMAPIAEPPVEQVAAVEPQFDMLVPVTTAEPAVREYDDIDNINILGIHLAILPEGYELVRNTEELAAIRRGRVDALEYPLTAGESTAAKGWSRVPMPQGDAHDVIRPGYIYAINSNPTVDLSNAVKAIELNCHNILVQLKQLKEKMNRGK